MIVLDTSLLSHAYRRSATTESSAEVARLRALILDDADLVVPGIVLQELLSGVRGDATLRRLEDELASFRLLLADRETHVAAAALRSTCAAKGVAAASIDCLIAAHAVQVDAELFTLDDDFRHIATHSALRLHRV